LTVAPAAAQVADDLPTEDHPGETFAAGRILGGRYRIRSLLGRGGMGEVWRALDLKLRVDVALKALRASLSAEPRALESLHQEVRAARQVVSPNVCRIFDLIELDGRELVSMEYVDGMTLAGVLASRSPLTADEAREIAAQLLAGLEAIHAAGLVHRDIKPENVMLTRAGRLVVMDFGLAKALASERVGTVAGTAAYMAPEQGRRRGASTRGPTSSRGHRAGELLSGRNPPKGGPRSDLGGRPSQPAGSRRHALGADPPKGGRAAQGRPLPERCRAGPRPRGGHVAGGRRGAARALPRPRLVRGGERGLLLRPRARDRGDVVQLRRPHLLALAGPSGRGRARSSRAGSSLRRLLVAKVIATRETGRSSRSRRALIPELSGDPEGLELLLRIEEPDAAVAVCERWRRRHDQALVVLDQFEELFAEPAAVQAAFVALVGRLALDADVHVLLALRDDFLFRCHAHEPLQPILSDLTLLGPHGGGAAPALVQPRSSVAAVSRTKPWWTMSARSRVSSSSPLLAFATAQLWRGGTASAVC
jgi:hypothetical protein